MKLGLITSAFSQVGMDFADGIKHTREIGFDTVDIFTGAWNVLLVIGEYIWQQEVIPPQQQWNWAVEGVSQLGEYAGEKGVEICIELEPFKLSLVKNVDTMVKFLKDVNSPAVFANIDVSHVYLAGDDPSELRRLKGLARHVHFSDCDGKVHGDLPPGRGVIDFRPFMKELKDLEIEGSLSIELEYSPEPEKIVDWVREAYAATARLMDEVGLRS